MESGQKVKFKIYDSLFRKTIEATGKLVDNIYGGLWLIKPDVHKRLSGINVIVHEINILSPTVTLQGSDSPVEA